MQRIKLLMLFGGESAEHEVSISSARNVYAALDDQKYEVFLGYISKDGRWWLVESIDGIGGENPELIPVMGAKEFTVEPGGRRVDPDVILPILHGPNGEDGSVQGLAQLLHIPIVGCGVIGSAVCMDKDVAKRLLRYADIPVADWVTYRKGEELPDFAHLTLELGNPLFVKPANMGSSVGVSKVTDKQSFEEAMEQALQHDHKIIIEQGISGRELECAVLGNDKPEASGVGEIKADREFYSYESKYDPESTTDVVVPAENLDEEMVERIRELAVKAYTLLECRGFARADVFLADDGTVFVNELNTLPGFTNISMYPKLWRERGLHYPTLIDRLITLALEEK